MALLKVATLCVIINFGSAARTDIMKIGSLMNDEGGNMENVGEDGGSIEKLTKASPVAKAKDKPQSPSTGTKAGDGGRVQLTLQIVTGYKGDMARHDSRFDVDNQMRVAKIIAEDAVSMWFGKISYGPWETVVISTMEDLEKLDLPALPKEGREGNICAACITCVESGKNFFEFDWSSTEAVPMHRWCKGLGVHECSLKCNRYTTEKRQQLFSWTKDFAGNFKVVSEDKQNAFNSVFSMTVVRTVDDGKLADDYAKETLIYIPTDPAGHYADPKTYTNQVYFRVTDVSV